MIYHRQTLDNSLLSYQKNFQPDWTKNGRGMAKKRVPIYGIIVILRVILAHNLFKYQHFSIRTWFIQITYCPQFVA